MARDQNLQEVFETVLYHRGIKESGAIARELHEAMMDFQEDQALNQIADERANGPFTAVDDDFFGIAKALKKTVPGGLTPIVSVPKPPKTQFGTMMRLEKLKGRDE